MKCFAVAVVRYRWAILLGWLSLAGALLFCAPRFRDVARDGDFDYLPPGTDSVAGGRLIESAFPGDRPRSEMVVIVRREVGEWSPGDDVVALDLNRRLHLRLARSLMRRHGDAGGAPDESVEPVRRLITSELNQAIDADEKYYRLVEDRIDVDTPPRLDFPRLADAYATRGRWLRSIGRDADGADDLEAARVFYPPIGDAASPGTGDDGEEGWDPLLDLMAWDDPVIGAEMISPSAKLTVLRLSSELAATSNIETLSALEDLVDRVRATSMPLADAGLDIGITGSAAIGGETLIAARDAIRYTEAITVAMIVLILALVYRAPLLVVVPMLSIGVAVAVSLPLVSSIAAADVGLRLFTTSRIFIVVILFGAGTDFCLFLIARLREQSATSPWPVAVRDSVVGVGGALVGSAMTTVVGLAMLGLADFGKFRSTGPVVAICLSVGLLVCLTFTPALLSVIGPVAFWPTRSGDESSDRVSDLWKGLAVRLTMRPAAWLIGGLALLGGVAAYGWTHQDEVTYDLASELDTSATSRRGMVMLRRGFDVGRITPVTLLVQMDAPEERDVLRRRVRDLTSRLYDRPGVVSVRNADDPLGKFPPGREMSMLGADSMKRRLLRQHRSAQNVYFSGLSPYDQTLFRVDVAIDRDPFNPAAGEVVGGLRRFLADESKSGGIIAGAETHVTGAAASLTDLRRVIASDNRRIRIAVTLGVLAVLILVLRRIGLSLYLIATVLLSYYATLGLTVAFFRLAYGETYVGLDWKLPVFLFVILVAIGQDYNVYLTTRIIEERRTRPLGAALRRAVSRTGGIITACGLVMAATFFSMTASAWLPPIIAAFGGDPGGGRSLRGIVELGFALGLGMIVDTFYVRTVLVPTFVAVTRGRV